MRKACHLGQLGEHSARAAGHGLLLRGLAECERRGGKRHARGLEARGHAGALRGALARELFCVGRLGKQGARAAGPFLLLLVFA